MTSDTNLLMHTLVFVLLFICSHVTRMNFFTFSMILRGLKICFTLKQRQTLCQETDYIDICLLFCYAIWRISNRKYIENIWDISFTFGTLKAINSSRLCEETANQHKKTVLFWGIIWRVQVPPKIANLHPKDLQ